MKVNSFRFSAGVTLFNPTIEEVNNIINYSEIFEKIYVYDNSTEQYDCTSLNRASIEIISKGSNDGVGKACRVMTERAKSDQFDFIMLFDQDSKIDRNNIMRMLEFIDNELVEAMVYCPQIVFSKKTNIIQGNYKFVDWCITSGSVIRLSDYGEKVSFDDNYFIDRVDRDFCYQIKMNNKRICQVNDALLFQQLGETAENGYSTHQPFRHYYIARNRAYFNKKYGKSIFLTFFQSIKHIFIIIKYEPQKMNKIKMVFRGILDYRKGKMGCM